MHQDLVSKVVRCHSSVVFRREDLPINSKVITGINVSVLEDRFNAGDEVTLESLLEKRIVRKLNDGVKILGNGELTKKLTVKVNAFSQSAKEKIEACGGTCEVI